MRAWIATVLLAASACSVAARPTPLHLEATTLDGHVVDVASLGGSPQVIALWLPG